MSVLDKLTPVRQVDAGESYDWDVIGLFRDDNGDYWIGHDAGCSCSYPWEFVTDLSDFTRVYTMTDVARFVSSCWTGEWSIREKNAKFDFLSGLSLDKGAV